MSPSRSTKVTIENKLAHDLVLGGSSLDHGIWTQSLSPPNVIAAGATGIFQAESAGVMTGDQGYAKYSIANVGDAAYTFKFDNPFSGSNSYDCSAPTGYSYNQTGGGGNNAEVTWACVQVCIVHCARCFDDTT